MHTLFLLLKIKVSKIKVSILLHVIIFYFIFKLIKTYPREKNKNNMSI